MDEIALALPVIRSCFPTLKAPCPSDRVAFECSYTFDTAFSEGGLYVNLQAYTAAGAASLALDRARTPEGLFDLAAAHIRGVPVMTSVSAITRAVAFVGGGVAMLISGGIW